MPKKFHYEQSVLKADTQHWSRKTQKCVKKKFKKKRETKQDGQKSKCKHMK